MKRILTVILIALISFSIGNAQGDTLLKNKNGYPLLPEQGDIAVGMTMTPIFNYFGNFFHGNNATFFAPTANFAPFAIQPNAVFVKYFVADDAALRFTFEFTAASTTNSIYMPDDAALINDPMSNAQVTDIMTSMNRNYVAGFGYEKRRGSTRLQGHYGAGLLLSYGNTKQNYQYGNPMSAANPMPSTNDFGANLHNGGRILNNYDGEQLGFGANVFMGVEYFILPKISLGAEFSYGVMLAKTKQAKFDYEYWNVDHYTLIEQNDPGDVQRILGTRNPSGNFFLMFHF